VKFLIFFHGLGILPVEFVQSCRHKIILISGSQVPIFISIQWT